MTDGFERWQMAKQALSLLAVDPSGLGGIWLRARNGPVRDRFLAALAPTLAPRRLKRLHPALTDDQLFGGLDLAATLESGKTVIASGLLTGQNDAFLLTMAERTQSGTCARIAAALDANQGHCLLALDEGDEDEQLATTLTDRLAFHLDLDGLALGDCPEITLDHDRIDIARLNLKKVSVASEFVPLVTKTALSFGVFSMRAPSFLLRAARTVAAIQRASEVTEQHIATAAALVLAPRATSLPEELQEQIEEQASQEPEHREPDTGPGDGKIPDDVILQAVMASLPRDLLSGLSAAKAQKSAQGNNGSGDAKKGNRRGRPKPSRRGRMGGAARIDLVSTLYSAAPWQALRRQAPFAPDRPVHIRASDIRLKTFEERSDRLLIFVVDASGSAALARLAEAKGAVELLLSEAYARRDHVALVAFRGTKADVLLPPTRSLVQTKRRLAHLPGGGGTPLAAGLEAALTLSLSTRKKGFTPTIALLTDGRANIALDGSANRMTATEDANAMAKLIRAHQTPALVIDTGTRPQPGLKALADGLSAPYLPLPRADSQIVSQAIEAAFE
ncbi:MAG: magnesium chelatase subunit D [Pseudomonadota bacterium]